METRPEKAMSLAVNGMLPNNTLGRAAGTRLRVYAGAQHEQAAQKPEAYGVLRKEAVERWITIRDLFMAPEEERSRWPVSRMPPVPADVKINDRDIDDYFGLRPEAYRPSASEPDRHGG